MTPSDNQWRALTSTTDGSYDSLAASWNLLSPAGPLSSTAASHLLDVANQIGTTLNRRAASMPPPNDVTAAAANLLDARDALEIGFSLSVAAESGGWLESEIWNLAGRLGLDLMPDGAFGWRASGHSFPLLELSPLGEKAGFSLGQAQSAITHPAVQIGFLVPLNPFPTEAFEQSVRIAKLFADELAGTIYDDEDRAWSQATYEQYRRNLELAIGALDQAGFPPGSASAIALFS
jgi:hypothetical protein